MWTLVIISYDYVIIILNIIVQPWSKPLISAF